MNPPDYRCASPEGAKSWEPASLVAPPVAQAGQQPVVSASPAARTKTDVAAPKLVVIVGVIMAILSIFNATMVPVMVAIRPGWAAVVGIGYMYLLLGSFGGQAAILTVLVVWGSGPLWQRLVWHWVLVSLAVAGWVFGLLVAMSATFGAGDFPEEVFFAALTGLPLIALACQAMPWMFKTYFNWRIQHFADEPQPASAQRLTIRDIFVGTIIVALSMAAIRLGKPAYAVDGIYWAGWMIGAAVAAGISLVCLVPLVYLTLGVRRASWGACGVVAANALVISAASGIMPWFGPGGPPSWAIILMMVMIATGFTLTLCGTMWILRANGYRLATSPPHISPFAPPTSAGIRSTVP